MANTLKMKRSAVAAKVPTTSDLALGEIAINTYDGKVYIKKDNGTASIVEVGGSPTVADGSITTAKLGGDITTAGKALLDDADAAAQRTTLGLGSMATQNANNVNITGGTISGATINPLPGDSIVTARSLSAPSYIGTAGTYLKADYPLIGSLPGTALYGATWDSSAFPGGTSYSSYFYAAAYGGGVWIASSLGTPIRRSADNGLTWSSVQTGGATNSYVPSIAYGNGVWIYCTYGVNGVRRSTDGGLTWSLVLGGQNSPNGIATDGAGVWITVQDSGVIYRSANNGLTWSAVTSGTTLGLYKVAYGNGVWITVGASGALRRSTDGGITWTAVSSGAGSTQLNDVATDGAGVWTIVTEGYYAIRSTNNGASFSPITSIGTVVSRVILTDSAGTWLFFTSSGIYRSTNNGSTWSGPEPNVPDVIGPVGGGYGGGVWLAAGVNGFRSTDGGVTWSFTPVQTTCTVTALAKSGNTAIVVPTNTVSRIGRSTDNGSSWSMLALSVTGINSIQDIAGSGNVFIICGFNSVGTNAAGFYRSSDGGATWTNTSPAATSNSAPYRIATNGNGTWIAGGLSGVFYRSTNDGVSWGAPFTTASLGTSNSINAIASNGGNVWMACTGTAVARSTDNGVTWTAITTGLSGGASLSYGSGVWFVVSPASPYARYSTDNGDTWATPTGIGTSGFYMIGSDGGGKWATVDRLSKDNGVTFSAYPTSPNYTGGSFLRRIVFFGAKITLAGSSQSLDGSTSATQFSVGSELANPGALRYLYTGQ